MGRMLYYNGTIMPEDGVRISPLDHGFLYGDGIFEGIRVYAGRIFQLEDHLDRLYQSAKSLLLTIRETPEQMAEALKATVAANRLQDAYIRLVVSRGPGDLGLDPRQCPEPTVVIIADRVQLFPEALYESGLALATAASRRPSGDVLNPQIKSLNYLNSVLAKIEAAQRGVAEMVLLNQLGHVVEGTADNVFIVRNQSIVTPPRSAGILPGITRAVVMELAKHQGIRVSEENFTVHELYNAEECFLTGTAAEIIAAVSCDGRMIGDGSPGPITRALRTHFVEYAATHGTPVYPGVSVI